MDAREWAAKEIERDTANVEKLEQLRTKSRKAGNRKLCKKLTRDIQELRKHIMSLGVFYNTAERVLKALEETTQEEAHK